MFNRFDGCIVANYSGNYTEIHREDTEIHGVFINFLCESVSPLCDSV